MTAPRRPLPDRDFEAGRRALRAAAVAAARTGRGRHPVVVQRLVGAAVAAALGVGAMSTGTTRQDADTGHGDAAVLETGESPDEASDAT